MQLRKSEFSWRGPVGLRTLKQLCWMDRVVKSALAGGGVRLGGSIVVATCWDEAFAWFRGGGNAKRRTVVRAPQRATHAHGKRYTLAQGARGSLVRLAALLDLEHLLHVKQALFSQPDPTFLPSSTEADELARKVQAHQPAMASGLLQARAVALAAICVCGVRGSGEGPVRGYLCAL